MTKTARLVLAVAGCVLAGIAHAQSPDVGLGLYNQYCASCHGASGTGDGPMAEFLTLKSPDLTGLSAANDGNFPMLKVIHIIDGRTGLRAHGGPMPVFGTTFAAEHPDMARNYAEILETRGRVLSLAMYLETLQK